MTAQEHLRQHFPKGYTTQQDILNWGIEFAKFHVEAALKQAAEDACMTNDSWASMQEGTTMDIEKSSILEAYPLTNIK